MSINTKALLSGKIDIVELAKAIHEEYGAQYEDLSINFTFLKDEMFTINFMHKKPEDYRLLSFKEKGDWRKNNRRNMYVNYGCKGDYSDITTDDMTIVSLGWWGESVEIMEALLKKYGGYIMRNDSSDDWEKF